MTTRQIQTASIGFIFLISSLQLGAHPAGNDNITRVVSALETAIIERDPDRLSTYLAPDFSVSVATLPGALKYLASALEKAPEIDSVRIVSLPAVTTGSEDKTVKVAFYPKGGNKQISNLRLNSDGKIRYIDYLDRLYGMFRDKPSRLRAVVPFTFENDAIIITLQLNDSPRPLRFLFDTGADGMAISGYLADSIGLTAYHTQNTSLVGTNRSISVSSGNTVHLDTLSLPYQQIALFEEMNHYDGIIGLNLAKAFIVKVDFNRSELYLYDLGNYTRPEDETVVPVTVPDGVIQIACALNLLGKNVIGDDFIFDTGAGFHAVAFSPFVRKNRLLLSGFRYESQSSMVGMGHTTQVYHGKAAGFSFGGLHFEEMPITLQASSGSNDWDPGAAGSIGIQLIKRYNFTINLVNKEVYLKENEISAPSPSINPSE